VWIIKLDTTGNKEWGKTFGGFESDISFSIQQTKDEGYIVAGTTSSYGKGYPSIWIIKLDNKGDSLWTRIYEGTVVSSAQAIRQTSDGGYIVAGKGNENILKLDKNGNKEWGKHYGWVFYSVEQTADGGYITAGDSIFRQLDWDYIPSPYVIKLDARGNKEWSNPPAVNFLGKANSVYQTSDDGFIIAGDSIGFKTEFEHSHYLKVNKLNKNGIKEWGYLGNENSAAQSIEQTSDEGFIIAGNLTDIEYGLDFLIIRLDKNGVLKWTKTYGKIGGWEYASSIGQTSDGGYIVAGQTDSYGAGRYDLWILKLDENGDLHDPTGILNPINNLFSLSQNFPNPVRNSTTIFYSITYPTLVNLKVIDIFGREIKTLVNEFKSNGAYSVEFNAFGLSNGLYYYQLRINNKYTETKKMIIRR
jgi:hypothetical protein